MYEFKPLKIKGFEIKYPIIQGGMGVGISTPQLARAVADEGGLGILSSACQDALWSKRLGKKVDMYNGVQMEIAAAKEGGRLAGINIMRYIDRFYEVSVRAAIDAGVNTVVVGAGMPLDLPKISGKNHNTALIPIVSSLRAFKIIIDKWERCGYRPDAVIVEGPKAGGHLGFGYEDLWKEENQLENIYPPIKDLADKYGIPVIVAGGLYHRKDLIRFAEMGADGFQLGTRFLATYESGADFVFRNKLIDCTIDDIIVVDSEWNHPGSPCGLPFRIIKSSPMFAKNKLRSPCCNRGYLLQKDESGKYALCGAKNNNKKYFCICNGLGAACRLYLDEMSLWTVGANGWRVNRILSVKELMNRLKGVMPED